jgi:ArsR family transcriptional regulator
MASSTTDTHRLSDAALDTAAGVIKCLGHPLRLRLLEALEDGERTVSELQAHAATTQALVSHQLAILRGHSIVDARRDGPWVRYRITEPKVRHVLACIRACDAHPLPLSPSPQTRRGGIPGEPRERT